MSDSEMYLFYRDACRFLDHLLASSQSDFTDLFKSFDLSDSDSAHEPNSTTLATDIYIQELTNIAGYLGGLTQHFKVMRENLRTSLEKADFNDTEDITLTEKPMRSEFNVIAAVCRNNGIGFKNTLPWKLKNELAYFNRMTTETNDETLRNVVIMGRKTWSSIPPRYRPLDNRTNVVLSRAVATIEDRNAVDHIFSSLTDALEGVSQLRNKGQVWVIGGQSIYEEAIKLPQCKRIYLTKVDAHFECDTFFPDIDIESFKPTTDPKVPQEQQEEGGVTYNFHVYERTS
ncbi:Dihydrofolate reductase, partial [Fragariocoptes setiger]